jgi:hypothetical protein
MAEQVFTGKLVAIDGSRGNDVMNAAEALATEIREAGGSCAISRWDASGLFGDFLISSSLDTAVVSARTLSLLYAADLAFRLRWEIRPALAAGQIVIAAPYLETAVKFGEACGLTERWLHDLLRFAVGPDIRGLARERKEDKGWKGRRDRGYAEYCAGLLRQTGAKFKHKKTRASMIESLQRGRKSAWDLSKRGVEDAARLVLKGSPLASSSPKS